MPIASYRTTNVSAPRKPARSRAAIPFLKRFTVFNTDQCDGLPEEVAASVVPPPPGQIEPRAEALIAATGADFRIGGARAYYNATGDFVQVLPPAAYFEPINWHRTAFHELGHYAAFRIMPHGCAFLGTGAHYQRGISA
jgi:antirestriction protein ArdC